MSDPNESPDRPTDPGDERWLNRLLSKSTGQPASPDEAEADLLRAAIRRDAVSEAAAMARAYDDAAVERAADRVLASLRAAADAADAGPASSATPPPSQPSPASRRRSWWSMLADHLSGWQAGAAAMTAVAILAVAIILPGRQGQVDYPELPVVRGGSEPALVIQSAPQPRERAEAILRSVEAAGLPAAIYRQGPAFIVEFDVTLETLAAAADLLKSLGIPAAPGVFRVEVRPGD